MSDVYSTYKLDSTLKAKHWRYMSKDCYVTYICQLKQDNIYTINKPPKSMLYLQITNNGDKNDMVSQMAHAKNLGEPFMAHLEDLYNIPWLPYACVAICMC